MKLPRPATLAFTRLSLPALMLATASAGASHYSGPGHGPVPTGMTDTIPAHSPPTGGRMARKRLAQLKRQARHPPTWFRPA